MTMTCELTPLKLLLCCYPVIPSGAGPQGKSPLVPWQEYQHSFPTDDDLVKWENEYHPSLWGIVTGENASVVIIDIDKPELRTIFDNSGLYPHIQTPRGGYHYWFRHPGTHVKTVAGLLPGIDVRGDGGFVNVIGKRKDGEYKTLIVPLPESVYAWDKLPNVIVKAMQNGNGKQPAPEPEPQTGTIPEGQRNQTLARKAGGMRAIGLSEQEIESALLSLNARSCNPPLPENEVLGIAKSMAKYPTGNNKSYYTLPVISQAESQRNESVTKSVTDGNLYSNSVTRSQIEEWVRTTSGWFSYEDIDREFGIKSPGDKTNRRMAIMRLKEDRIIESHPSNNKLYRFVNVTVRLIDYKSALKKSPIDIKLPFNIEKYAAIYPGNIIVLAGAANAGKTAFLLNLIKANMYDFGIFYQSSEMGQDELAIRLEKFENISLDDWNFTAEERSHNFADVIRPDCINIIDYMELSTDCYMIAEYLKQIHDKLSSGIAIVALQKKSNADFGRGGEFGLEKPRLYLSMDKCKIAMTKAKNWANREVNPNGLVLNFKIVDGCKFVTTSDWHKEDEL